MTTTTSPTREERPPIGEVERALWAGVIAVASLLGVGGAVISFERVNDAMRPYFGGLAWMVPVGVDLGIAVFTALDLLMAHRDLRAVWLRYIPRGLVAVTIYLNVVGIADLEGKVAHAVLPGLWVVAVEVAGTGARTIFGLKTTGPRLERIRRSRWLLAPVATARLRRRMILREETSFETARQRDLAFELAKADMRDRYKPVLWRWKAPRRERLLLRRGEVAPVPAGQLPTVPVAALTPVSGPDGTGPGDAGTTGRGRLARGRAATRARSPKTTPADPETERRVAEQVAARMRAEGVPLTRRPFIDRMRAEGHRLGTKKATVLLRHLHERDANRNGDGTGPHPTGTTTEPHDHAPALAAAGATTDTKETTP